MSVDEIVAETERAIALLEQAGDERGLAEAWRLVGEARMYAGPRGRRAARRSSGRSTHARPGRSPRSWNALSFALGMCLLDGPAPLDARGRVRRERLDEARARGLRSLEADMLHVLGVARGPARRASTTAARRSRASTAISEELGLATWRSGRSAASASWSWPPAIRRRPSKRCARATTCSSRWA